MVQPGPVLTPESTALRTMRFVPAPSTACDPLPLPKTLNSACCHWLPRSGKILAPEAVKGWPLFTLFTVTAIPSLAAPLKPSVVAVTMTSGIEVPATAGAMVAFAALIAQSISVWPGIGNGHHPSDQTPPNAQFADCGTGQLEPGAPQSISQYWIEPPPPEGNTNCAKPRQLLLSGALLQTWVVKNSVLSCSE